MAEFHGPPYPGPPYPGPPYPGPLSRLYMVKREVMKDCLEMVCEGLGESELTHCIIMLRSRGLLDLYDAELIRSKDITMGKVEEMIDILKNREGRNGEHVLDVLIDVLKKAHPRLSQQLQKLRTMAIARDIVEYGLEEGVTGVDPSNIVVGLEEEMESSDHTILKQSGGLEEMNNTDTSKQEMESKTTSKLVLGGMKHEMTKDVLEKLALQYSFWDSVKKVPQKTHHGEEIVDERSEPGQKQIHEGLTRSVSLPDSLHRDDKDVAGSPQIMAIRTKSREQPDDEKSKLFKWQEKKREGDFEDNTILEVVTLVYTGTPMAFIWDHYGFELHCHKSVLPLGQKLMVEVSASTSGPFIFPEGHELVSGVYHIKCSQNIPATIKIQHCINQDIGRLIFAVSSHKYPPYKFKRLSGGMFESQFGTIDVENFSFYAIIYEWVFDYPPEVLYSFYLYHSRRPTYCGSTCIWNLYFFAIKKLTIFEEHLDDYIEKLPELLACIPITVELDADSEELRFEFEERKPDFLQVRTYGRQMLKKKEIDMYKGGRPSMCQLQVINLDLTVPLFSLFFVIKGSRDSRDTVAFHWPICRTETVLRKYTLLKEGELTVSDLLQVQEELFEGRTAWYEIGLSLGIKTGTLTAIKRDNSKVNDCFREMLINWLESDLEKSWKALANALKKEIVGNPSLATRIVEKQFMQLEVQI